MQEDTLWKENFAALGILFHDGRFDFGCCIGISRIHHLLHQRARRTCLLRLKGCRVGRGRGECSRTVAKYDATTSLSHFKEGTRRLPYHSDAIHYLQCSPLVWVAVQQTAKNLTSTRLRPEENFQKVANFECGVGPYFGPDFWIDFRSVYLSVEEPPRCPVVRGQTPNTV